MKNQQSLKENRTHGFSLIELIIVMLTISIIATIALPNLLKARRTANEASAVASLRMIVRSELVFKYANLDREFATLNQLHAQQHIDDNIGLAPNAKNGYLFSVELIPSAGDIPARFNARANPAIHSFTNAITGTGSRHFGSNEAGAIFETNDATAVAFDPVARTPIGTATPFTAR